MDMKGLNLPDAEDLDPLTIKPERELESCNDLLDDADALKGFYEGNGYLLARNVLNPGSVAEARDMMLAVAAGYGLIEPGDIDAKWTGKPSPGGLEESDEFRGVAKVLWGRPDNLDMLARLLGEEVCWVPNVQYRIYPPGSSFTPPHQDGFYSPGIHNYRPVWTTLTPCQREVGGLMIAVGQNNRGWLHNLSKPGTMGFPIPEGVIPDDSWATTDYFPGDVLIVHPYAPHASMANTSDRLRVSFDTRVQSSSNPTAFAATVVSAKTNAITLDIDDVGEQQLQVDEKSFVRIQSPGATDPLEKLVEIAKPGLRLQVVIDGERAQMLRRLAAA